MSCPWHLFLISHSPLLQLPVAHLPVSSPHTVALSAGCLFFVPQDPVYLILNHDSPPALDLMVNEGDKNEVQRQQLREQQVEDAHSFP